MSLSVLAHPLLRRQSDAADVADRHVRTTLGWMLVLALCCVVAGLLLVGRGGMLTLLFPLLCLGVGGFLFATSPNLFLGFAWWLWFLTPEVRRIADWQGGWNPVNPLMLAPLLVSGLTIMTVFRRPYDLTLRGMGGFLAIFIALFYGTVVGIVTTGATVALYSLAVWAVPVLLAFHVAARPEAYPENSRTLTSVFGWGACVMGIYGIAQFFLAPPWDTFWMIVSEQFVQGKPYPMQIRVFSTMNSSGPFAFVISAGLLLLLAGRGRLRLPMAVLGLGSLLLSLVRAAWLGWVFGFIYLLVCLQGRKRLHMLVFAGCAALVMSMTLLTGPVQEHIAKRFDTFTDLQEDDSFQLRQQFYLEFMSRALTDIVGEGIGSTSYVTKASNYGEIASGFTGDSGIMQVPFVLGWFGGVFYVGGVGALIAYAFRGRVPSLDVFFGVSKAIVLMVLAEMVFENTLINVMGACFFTYLGMCIAARRYYRALQPAAVPVAAPRLRRGLALPAKGA